MIETSRNGGDPGDPADFDMYLSPYERWNFDAGRGYALPLLRQYWKYISAVAELGAASNSNLQSIQRQGWLPTLWGDPKKLTFIPFIVFSPFGEMPTLEQLADLLRNAFYSAMEPFLRPPPGSVGILLDRIKQSRFRVAFPIPDKAMHKPVKGQPPQPDPPVWHPDEGLRDRIGKKTRITVIAVIDDGIPFAHRNFRDETGRRTRVEFCWLQSVAIEPGQTSVRFGREYTRDQIETLIARHGDDEDTLYRKAHATADTEGLGSLINRHASHGAHVMDLATGYAPERGRPAPDGTTPDEEPREEIRIIAVQLPNTIAWDTSGFGKDMYMLSAFHYIFDRADIIARDYEVENLRLVINFSYGFSGGRHDGETELEAAVDELVCKRRTRCAPPDDPLLGPSPTALVLPAGNTFLDRLHAEIVEADFARHGNIVEIPWRIQPNDRTPSYLELWFWGAFSPSEPFGFTVALRDPDGNIVSLRDSAGKPQTSLQVGADHQGDNAADSGDPRRVYAVLSPQQQVIGQLSADWHRGDVAPEADGKPFPQRTGRWRVLVVIAPTEPEDSRLPRAAAGKWTVVIERTIPALTDCYPIHCWIQRSSDPESLRSGSRQSYFDEWAYEKTRFTAEGDLSEVDTEETLVQRFGSLNGLATGRTALVVGGYRLRPSFGSSLACASPARYSSAGVLQPDGADQEACVPPCPHERTNVSAWPDKQVNASSMSERSRVLPGTIAAGVRSGSLSLVQGTSSAAPFVARQLAEVFAAEKNVPAAPHDNYLSLLCGYEPEIGKKTSPPSDNGSGSRKDDPKLIKARLGAVLVPPHWQPGIEPNARDQTA
jgi:hypothetical protein